MRVFCNSPRYSNETWQRQSKVDNFVKSKADAKSFVWNFFANLVNKADGRLYSESFQQRVLYYKTAYKVAK